jgi:glycosyltransferase involved in cell wall biosynthesis
MTIGVDLRCLPSDGSPGAGVAHASRSLVNKLIAHGGDQVSWVLFLPRGASPKAEENILREKTSRTRIVRLKDASGAVLRRALTVGPCDLLFVPSGAIPPGIRIPSVPWVHDIAIFDHPEWFNESLLRRRITTTLFRRGVKKAPCVFAVSEATKRDLVDHFEIDPKHVLVTFEGGDGVLGSLHGESLVEAKRIAKRRLAERGVTNRFILCMGTLEPRKNIPFLIDAWSKARGQFRRPTDLVIAGRDGWKLGPIMQAFDVAKVYGPEGGSRLHRIEAPNDDDRRDLLLAADLVAIPSLYEGFGLVALEGMQAGSAVLVSNAGALPEVVGPDFPTLQVGAVKAWTDALSELLNDERSIKRLADAGKARSQGMDWERVAEVVFHALTELSV